MSEGKGLETLNEIYHKYALDDLADSLKEELEEVLSSGLSIAFLGSVKAGKSTLINALLGEELLPVQETPTTGCVTELRKGTSLKYSVRFASDQSQTEEVSASEAEQYILGEKKAERVLIETPAAELLQEDVFIVDTPGIKSTIEAHDIITQEYLPSVDAAFFVMSGQYGAPQVEILDFIRDDVKDADLDKLYFIVSKSDLFSDEEVALVEKEFRKHLSTVVKSPRIFSVSGLQGLESKQSDGRTKTGNIGMIEHLIREEILPRKKKVIKSRHDALVSDRAEQLIGILGRIRKDSKLDTEELKETSKEIEKEIEKLNALRNRLLNGFAMAKEEGYLAADATAARLVDSLADSYRETGVISDEKLAYVLEDFQAKLRTILSDSLREIDGIDQVFSLPDFQDVIGDVSTWNDIISVFDKIATFAATAWIAPGSATGLVGKDLVTEGIPAMLVSLGETEHRDQSASAESPNKLVGMFKYISNIINKFNIIHVVAERVKPLVFKSVSSAKFRRKMRTYTEDYFKVISRVIDAHLEVEVSEPLTQKHASYASLLNLRREKREKYERRLSEITGDVRVLKGFVRGDSDA